jgi:tRNA threonylcarbamoyladenosine modification (KEOPS) complex  Pcc1 subunit
MMRASIRIATNNNKETYARALMPETRDEISRGSVNITRENDSLIINIEAEDAVALRAALNSHLRWTKLAIDTNEVIGAIP